MGNEVINVKDLKREIEEIYEKYLMKGIFYDEVLEDVIKVIDKLKYIASEENSKHRTQWKQRIYGTTLDPCCYEYECSVCGNREDIPAVICPHCNTPIKEIVNINNKIERMF
jgi:rubrerythrin